MLRGDLLEAGEMVNFCKTFSSDAVVEITKYTFLNMFFFLLTTCKLCFYLYETRCALYIYSSTFRSCNFDVN